MQIQIYKFILSNKLCFLLLVVGNCAFVFLFSFFLSFDNKTEDKHRAIIRPGEHNTQRKTYISARESEHITIYLYVCVCVSFLLRCIIALGTVMSVWMDYIIAKLRTNDGTAAM